ncbi:hypothetical protein EC973_004568 [Apophysomyces ossiformis]|uniref:Protein kinase domain-containing protein n=1 Tax=Apophysomyces ossiformis TaxID=679940 RepID=A0A8H7BZM7_9FUNG|nr:hypothetical protein EC973_004568 [Apophysomyces ossiformis]
MLPNELQDNHADAQLLINSYVDDNMIQLQSILGTGAYGVVYLGRHRMTGKSYAVKWITNTKSAENEIRIHSHLNGHKNILGFKKVVREYGKIFLILEYARGGDLFAAITKCAVPDNQTIRQLFIQILDAIQHCHQHGVAHRDLKPENILLVDRCVKLADFGLATTQPVSAEFGCGSTFYFSPECQGGVIRDNKRIKAYSTQLNDIWSLGVILINLVAGRNPWRQANLGDPTFAAYARKPRRFFRQIFPCISSELDLILQRIFCLDPARRISLPELRYRILSCTTFLRDKEALTSVMENTFNVNHTNFVPTSQPVKMSLTILDYVNYFTDDFSPSASSSLIAPPTPSCSSSSSSSSSSETSLHYPAVPETVTLNQPKQFIEDPLLVQPPSPFIHWTG